MNIEETLEQMARQTYSHKVDVVEDVMATVSQRPYLRPVHRQVRWRPVGTAVAAAVALLLVVGFAMPFLRSYNEDDMSSMMVQANDYASWGTVEQAAVNPIEFLFEE